MLLGGLATVMDEGHPASTPLWAKGEASANIFRGNLPLPAGIGFAATLRKRDV